MTLEDVLKLQRNNAMDAVAQASVIINRLETELAALKKPPAPTPDVVIDMVPRQAAKVADPA